MVFLLGPEDKTPFQFWLCPAPRHIGFHFLGVLGETTLVQRLKRDKVSEWMFIPHWKKVRQDFILLVRFLY